MKKKITVAALVVCLLSVLVGTSLAYFMDTDEATNTFTVGSVEIEQVEVFDDENAQLLPVVGTNPTNAADNYIQKKVTVKNTGKNSAYVQTYVAVPAALDDAGVLKLWDENYAANGWEKYGPAKNVTVNGEACNVYCYRYNTILTPGTEAAACLEYVYIDSVTDLNTYDTNNNGSVDTAYFVMNGTEITEFNATGELNIYVASQAVQEDGFADATAALEAAFPNYPWA